MLAHVCDVADASALEELRDATLQRFGRIDLVHLNAGISPATGAYSEPDAWRKIIDVNLFGVVNGIQAFVPEMVETFDEGGLAAAVIITGSKQGITTPPGNPAYNCSKAAVKAAAEALAHQLRADGDRISVHLLVPGYTYTGLTRRGQADKPAEAWAPEQVVDYMLPRLAARDFYIICPDNTVDEALDNARMEWAVGDVIERRPALSRWHDDYKDAFAAHVKARTGK